MAKEIIAGIGVSDRVAHLTVFEVKEHKTKLLHLEEFTKSIEDDLWFLKQVADSGNRALKNLSKVSVAINANSAFLHLFPMDTTLTQPEQNEHVHWELANNIQEYHAQDFVHDIHTLKVQAREQVADVLVVAVRRSFLNKIQEFLTAKKLELYIADTNYFGAEQALYLNYPENKIRTFALICSAEQRVDVGIEKNGRLIHYGYTLSNSPDEIVKLMKRIAGDAAIDQILCCGSYVQPHLIDLIHNSTEIPVELLNPFRQFIKTSTFGEFNSFNGRKHRYAASTGVALWK